MTAKNPRSLALILQRASYEKLHLAATLAATTTAMGGEVHIFLSHEALLSYIEGKIDEGKPKFESEALNQRYVELLEEGKIPKPSLLFKRAKELGTVKFYGCSESAQLFRLGPELTKKLDAVIGYTTFLNIASNARLLCL